MQIRYDNIDNQVNSQIDNLHNIANSISTELDALQEEQDKYRSISINNVEMPQSIDTMLDEPVIEPIVEVPIVEPESDIEQFEMPVRIAESQIINEPKSTINNNNVFSSVYAPPKVEMPVISDDENEIELPKLKQIIPTKNVKKIAKIFFFLYN